MLVHGKDTKPVHPNMWIEHCHRAVSDQIDRCKDLQEEVAGITITRRGTIRQLLGGLSSAAILPEWKLTETKGEMERAVAPDADSTELDDDPNVVDDIDDDDDDKDDDEPDSD